MKRLALASLLALGTSTGAAGPAWGQTPTTPPAEQGQPQPGQSEAQPPATPAPAEQQIPLQQLFTPQPGRTPATPGTPPSMTVPPWTPPVPPAPSQTNVPSPFPYAIPGGAPGAVGGIPNLTMPGAFAPTVTTVRGATLEFHPTARASLEYSDNFFQTSSGAEDNFRSILGPGFTLFLNGARTFGTLSTTVDLVHDTASNSGDDVKVFPSMNLAVRYALTPRLALTVTNTFIRTDQADAVTQAGIRRGRQIYDTNTLGLTADWIIDQVVTQAYYRNVLFFNESGTGNQDSPNDQGNSVTNIFGVNASTRVLVDYILQAGYEFSRVNQTSGSDTTGGDSTSNTVFASAARQIGLYASAGLMSSAQFQSEENTQIYNVSLFGTYGLPTGLSLSARLGYSFFNSNDDSNNNDGGFAGAVTAAYRFARAVIQVGVSQDFQQTGQTGQNFGTVAATSYFGNFLYQWTPFINTNLNVTYSENQPTGTGNTASGQSQTALTYGASLNWQILRWLTASVRYTYTKQTGNDLFNQTTTTGGTGDFAENRASINFFFVF